ncbi:MAG: tetratricopeptide repeat protein [Cyanobacteria bacterium J06600_6]
MKKSTSRQTHWLDIAEITAVVGSVGGSVTSIFFKQFLWVTVPLSFSAGIAIINHQRLKQLVASEQEAVAFLIEENHARITKLNHQAEKQHWDNKVEFKELKQTSERVSGELERLDFEQKVKLDRAKQELQTLQASMMKLDELTSKLDREQNETRKLAGELKAIEKFTQIIGHSPNSAEAYYKRALAYQRTGNIERAIEDFGKTIFLESDRAEAHHQRGLLYLDIELPQKAIIDFRRAAQHYISQGNLDKYREARDLGLKIHFHQSAQNDELETEHSSKPKSHPVAVNNLFS